MENPNEKEAQKEQARKNIFSGRLKFGLVIIGAIFVFQGLSQMNKGFKEVKESSTSTEVAQKSGSDFSQIGPEYKDPKGSLKLNYPSEWKVDAGPTVTNPFQASGQGGVVDYRISQEPLSRDLTSKEYLEAMDRIFKTDPKISSMTNLSETAVNYNGIPGLTRVHIMVLNGKDIKIKQMLYIIIKDRNAYCAVASTPVDLFDKEQPNFEKVNKSIRFE